jgi:bacterioferritin
MKAKDGIVQFPNDVLKAELTAVHQYLINAGLCKQLVYDRLHKQFMYLSIE